MNRRRSTDGTSERAAELGVHHVLRFPQNVAGAAAFTAVYRRRDQAGR